MNSQSITFKLFAIGVVALVCLMASMLVLRLVEERRGVYAEAQAEIGQTWGAPQTVVGPVLVFETPALGGRVPAVSRYVLPRTLKVESVLTPEVRSRGIYDTVVYTETLKVHGTFASDDMGVQPMTADPVFAVALSDARSIETQVLLSWNDVQVPFAPGPGEGLFEGAGIHARVPYARATKEYSFSFTLTLRGVSEARFVPVGQETEVAVTSPWQTPSFVGAFLPSDRNISSEGFSATWHVSSFGRNYPQTWESTDVVSLASLTDSAFGVSFYDGVDLYTQLFRSIKYAVLFIVITFTVFFLFEVLQNVRVHPIQYLLIGSALALFYLLLLSLAEQIGFLYAYLIATIMTTLLVVGYSASVLKQKSRALLVGVKLLVLYGYLYFVLKLEDYALLFGALLLFALLASVMFLTRNVDWFRVAKGEGDKR